MNQVQHSDEAVQQSVCANRSSAQVSFGFTCLLDSNCGGWCFPSPEALAYVLQGPELKCTFVDTSEVMASPALSMAAFVQLSSGRIALCFLLRGISEGFSSWLGSEVAIWLWPARTDHVYSATKSSASKLRRCRGSGMTIEASATDQRVSFQSVQLLQCSWPLSRTPSSESLIQIPKYDTLNLKKAPASHSSHLLYN